MEGPVAPFGPRDAIPAFSSARAGPCVATRWMFSRPVDACICGAREPGLRPAFASGAGPHHRISRPRHARTLAERETLRERVVERGRRKRRARRHDRTPERALRRPVIGASEARREAVPRRRDSRTAFRKTRTTPVRRIDAHVLPPDRPPVDERRRRHGRHGARRAIVHIGIANVHGLVDMHIPVHAIVVTRAPAVAMADATARPGRAETTRRPPPPHRRSPDRHSSRPRRRRRRRTPPARAHRRAAQSRRAVPAPRPSAIRRRPSGHSDRARNPTAHRRPRSSPTAPARPSVPADTAPSPPATAFGTHTSPYADLLLPRAIGVEILIAGDVARHVARGNRAVFCRVAARGPLIEASAAGAPFVRDLLQGRCRRSVICWPAATGNAPPSPYTVRLPLRTVTVVLLPSGATSTR